VGTSSGMSSLGMGDEFGDHPNTSLSLEQRFDLKPYGIQKESYTAFLEYRAPEHDFDRISFSGNNNIVVGFRTQEGKEAAPHRVHAIVLDLANWKVQSVSDWLVTVSDICLLATTDGRFIVRTRGKITLYSPQIKPLKEFEIPYARKPVFEEWRISVTPSRKSIALEHYLGHDLNITWIDAESLSALRSGNAPSGIFGLVSNFRNAFMSSDDMLVGTVEPELSKNCEVSIAKNYDPWKILYQAAGSCGYGAQAINSETIFLPKVDEWLLLDTGGRVLHQEALGKNERAVESRMSANGERIVIPILTSKGGIEALDISPRILFNRLVVFDLIRNAVVEVVDSHQLNLDHLTGFALSPDGSRLALLRNDAVEIYRLPVDMGGRLLNWKPGETRGQTGRFLRTAGRNTPSVGPEEGIRRPSPQQSHGT
jgi:hypothetical protein